MGINLLPPKYQPQPFLQLKKAGKILIISLSVFVLIFAGQAYFFYRSTLDQRLENINNNIANLQPILDKVVEYETTMAQVKEIEEIANQIGKAKQVWSEILVDVAGSLDSDIWFVQISKNNNQVMIGGKATNFQTVGDYALKLRGLQWFKFVDVTSADKIIANDTGEYIAFSITAELRQSIELFAPPESGEKK